MSEMVANSKAVTPKTANKDTYRKDYKGGSDSVEEIQARIAIEQRHGGEHDGLIPLTLCQLEQRIELNKELDRQKGFGAGKGDLPHSPRKTNQEILDEKWDKIQAEQAELHGG